MGMRLGNIPCMKGPNEGNKRKISATTRLKGDRFGIKRKCELARWPRAFLRGETCEDGDKAREK